jgi:hypothetical protein
MQFPDPADGYPVGGRPLPGGSRHGGRHARGGYPARIGPPAPGGNPAPAPVSAPREWPRALLMSLATLAGTAVLGVAAGFGWAAIAPRAALVLVGRGTADLVSSETSAFIAADGWYCLICLVGGVVSGLLGHWLAVRRHGPLGMAAVLIGALAAGLITFWIGEQSGLATFHHLLSTLPAGAHMRANLVLGARGAIAFWPLAAGLMAGGLELSGGMRDRRQPAAAPAWPTARRGSPGAVSRVPGRPSGPG